MYLGVAYHRIIYYQTFETVVHTLKEINPICLLSGLSPTIDRNIYINENAYFDPCLNGSLIVLSLPPRKGQCDTEHDVD